MTKNRIVARAKYCRWQPKIKRNRKINKKLLLGSVNFGVLMVVFVFLAGMTYLYLINSSAVKGYQIRQIEKEIHELKKDNEQLRIREAELKSLYYIEESTKKMDMEDLKNISYVEETGPVALK